MIAAIEIVTGLFLGCMGFLQIPDNPVSGSSALFISGLLLLSGIDGFTSRKEVAGSLGNANDAK